LNVFRRAWRLQPTTEFDCGAERAKNVKWMECIRAGGDGRISTGDSNVPLWKLNLLYDGECPFCRREVERLKRRDRAADLALEDISGLGFDPGKYGLTRTEVQRVLHGVTPNGTVLEGMDAVREAYRIVGLGWLAAPTRLPLLRTASDLLYRLFARWRGPLGQLVAGGCPRGTCAISPPGAEPGSKPAIRPCPGTGWKDRSARVS
jgi:predicted DCC family thiol-disulfide oxidoreductase YuxK